MSKPTLLRRALERRFAESIRNVTHNTEQQLRERESLRGPVARHEEYERVQNTYFRFRPDPRTLPRRVQLVDPPPSGWLEPDQPPEPIPKETLTPEQWAKREREEREEEDREFGDDDTKSEKRRKFFSRNDRPMTREEYDAFKNAEVPIFESANDFDPTDVLRTPDDWKAELTKKENTKQRDRQKMTLKRYLETEAEKLTEARQRQEDNEALDALDEDEREVQQTYAEARQRQAETERAMARYGQAEERADERRRRKNKRTPKKRGPSDREDAPVTPQLLLLGGEELNIQRENSNKKPREILDRMEGADEGSTLAQYTEDPSRVRLRAQRDMFGVEYEQGPETATDNTPTRSVPGTLAIANRLVDPPPRGGRRGQGRTTARSLQFGSAGAGQSNRPNTNPVRPANPGPPN